MIFIHWVTVMKAKEYLKLSKNEQERMFYTPAYCDICSMEVMENAVDIPPHTYKGKIVCADCYYTEFGKVLDENPISINYKKDI